MADTIATYIGNGTQTDFSVPFDYLKKSFVRVYLDETTLLTGGDYGDTSVDYYFLDNTTVRLKTPPAEGVEVTIRRYTSATERIVSFEDASILKATDLDTSQLQSFHIAEEARDSVNDAILKDSEGNWDAKGNRITNVGDPVEGSDAINLDWYNKGAGKVQENANKTEQWRNEAEGFRNESETFKDEAEESSNLAKDWAIKMDGKVVEDTVEVDYSAKYWATSIKEYGVASIVVADNIEDVKQVSTNIDNVKLVGGDLEGSFSPPDFTDMGRVGTGATEEVEITGGNIKIVADNIEDVKNVGALIESGQVQVVIDSVETTNQNVIKAKQSEDNAKVSETNAKTSENSAKDWAVKMDGLVNNEDYSSKYYAQQAKNSADTVASTSEEINQAVTEGLEDISTATTQAVSQVETTTQQSITQVNQAGTTNVSNVNQAGTTQVGLVEQEGTDQVALVTAEGTKQVGLVETTSEESLSSITSEGTKQVGLVTTAGATQVGLVQTAGTSATEAISTAKDSAVSSVTSTGTSQVEAVNTASSTAQSTINNLVSTSTTNINASVQKAKDWAEKTDGEVEAGAYSAKYWAKQAAAVGGQSDWNEVDSNSLAYIKNKPDLTVYALKTELNSYALKTEIPDVSGFQTKTQHDADIQELTTEIDTKADQASLDLVVGTVNSMNTEIDGKAPSVHTHTASQVTDFTAQVQSLINSSRITDYGRVGS